MGLFSWIRFIIGIILSIEIIRAAIFGAGITVLAIALSIIFIIFTIFYIAQKIMYGM